MFITIYALDADYKDCAEEMGGAIETHEIGNVIDVEFNVESDGITLFTSENGCVSITSKHDIRMVLSADKFSSIEID